MARKCHILLVDDAPFWRDFLSSELAEQGYPVVIAGNGMEALDSIDSRQVDLILTDIFMPDMDGIELIRNLRKHFPDIPIFALSGGVRLSAPDDYLKYAKRFGANEVFTKPLEMAMLIDKLAQHCRHRTEMSV